MNEEQAPWLLFWDSIENGLNTHIDAQKNVDVDRYLRESLAFFSYYLEGVNERATLHVDLAKSAYPMIIQLHDLLRSNVIIQKSLLLTSAAGSLRTSFEIRINLKYVYQHPEPKVMLQRLADFVEYEEFIGRKNAKGFPNPTAQEEEAFAKKFPCWCTNAGKLKENAEWNGEGNTAKNICEIIGMDDHYFTMYKLTSKFVHGSPLVKHLYSTKNGYSFISSFENVGRFTVMSTHHAMYAFAEFLEFFGVPFSVEGFNLLQLIPVSLQESGKI